MRVSEYCLILLFSIGRISARPLRGPSSIAPSSKCYKLCPRLDTLSGHHPATRSPLFTTASALATTTEPASLAAATTSTAPRSTTSAANASAIISWNNRVEDQLPLAVQVAVPVVAASLGAIPAGLVHFWILHGELTALPPHQPMTIDRLDKWMHFYRTLPLVETQNGDPINNALGHALDLVNFMQHGGYVPTWSEILALDLVMESILWHQRTATPLPPQEELAASAVQDIQYLNSHVRPSNTSNNCTVASKQIPIDQAQRGLEKLNKGIDLSTEEIIAIEALSIAATLGVAAGAPAFLGNLGPAVPNPPVPAIPLVPKPAVVEPLVPIGPPIVNDPIPKPATPESPARPANLQVQPDKPLRPPQPISPDLSPDRPLIEPSTPETPSVRPQSPGSSPGTPPTPDTPPAKPPSLEVPMERPLSPPPIKPQSPETIPKPASPDLSPPVPPSPGSPLPPSKPGAPPIPPSPELPPLPLSPGSPITPPSTPAVPVLPLVPDTPKSNDIPKPNPDSNPSKEPSKESPDESPKKSPEESLEDTRSESNEKPKVKKPTEELTDEEKSRRLRYKQAEPFQTQPQRPTLDPAPPLGPKKKPLPPDWVNPVLNEVDDPLNRPPPSSWRDMPPVDIDRVDPLCRYKLAKGKFEQLDKQRKERLEKAGENKRKKVIESRGEEEKRGFVGKTKEVMKKIRNKLREAQEWIKDKAKEVHEKVGEKMIEVIQRIDENLEQKKDLIKGDIRKMKKQKEELKKAIKSMFPWVKDD